MRQTGLETAGITRIELIALSTDGSGSVPTLRPLRGDTWLVPDVPSQTTVLRVRVVGNRDTSVADFPCRRPVSCRLIGGGGIAEGSGAYDSSLDSGGMTGSPGMRFSSASHSPGRSACIARSRRTPLLCRRPFDRLPQVGQVTSSTRSLIRQVLSENGTSRSTCWGCCQSPHP